MWFVFPNSLHSFAVFTLFPMNSNLRLALSRNSKLNFLLRLTSFRKGLETAPVLLSVPNGPSRDVGCMSAPDKPLELEGSASIS